MTAGIILYHDYVLVRDIVAVLSTMSKIGCSRHWLREYVAPLAHALGYRLEWPRLVRVSVRLERGVKERLAGLARSRGATISELLREAVVYGLISGVDPECCAHVQRSSDTVLSFKIFEGLARLLDTAARSVGVSRSHLIRCMVRQYLGYVDGG